MPAEKSVTAPVGIVQQIAETAAAQERQPQLKGAMAEAFAKLKNE